VLVAFKVVGVDRALITWSMEVWMGKGKGMKGEREMGIKEGWP